MKISVVTAVYNNVRGIRSAIESVLAQKNVEVELVLIDGGSTDGTLDVIQSFGERIAIWVSEPDDGIYDALNKGLRLARGDVLGVLHSDDVLADDRALARVAAAFDEDPACAAVYGDLLYVSRTDPRRVIRRWRAGPFTRSSVVWGWMPPHPTLYCRRNLVEAMGEYDTGLEIAADYEWMLRLMRSGHSMGYIPAVQVRMATGGVSNASLGNLIRKSSEDWIALRRHGWSRTAACGTLLAKNLRKLPQFVSGGGERA